MKGSNDQSHLSCGLRIWLVAGITDMRNGFNGLASKVQNVLKDDPFSGHLFIFRGRRGDQIKVLWGLTATDCASSPNAWSGAASSGGHPRWKGSPYSGLVVHAS